MEMIHFDQFPLSHFSFQNYIQITFMVIGMYLLDHGHFARVYYKIEGFIIEPTRF